MQILQIGSLLQCSGYPVVAKRLIEIGQAQNPLGRRVVGIPVTPVVLPANNCPFGNSLQE